MDNFILVLGEPSNLLPGKAWTNYNVNIMDDKMVCTNKKDPSLSFDIFFKDFKEAEFGIGSGNLWLQCKLEQGSLIFCSPRKSWKSDSGKKLIEKINNVCEIKDMKAYKQYTGKLFFIYMFK